MCLCVFACFLRLLQARKALADRQKDLDMKTQQLEVKHMNKHEEDIKKARRKSTQAGQGSRKGSESESLCGMPVLLLERRKGGGGGKRRRVMGLRMTESRKEVSLSFFLSFCLSISLLSYSFSVSLSLFLQINTPLSVPINSSIRHWLTFNDHFWTEDNVIMPLSSLPYR